MTELPWKHDKNLGCKTIKGGKRGKHRQGQYKDVAWTVGLVDDDEDLANAEFIIRAVNNHDALVGALEAANEKLIAAGDTLKNLSKARYPCPEEFAVLRNKLSSYLETIKPEEQALAKAEGES